MGRHTRSHLILPCIPMVLPRHTPKSPLDQLRAHFASLLIDQLGTNPKPEQMDRIERLLWGRTFGSNDMNSMLQEKK